MQKYAKVVIGIPVEKTFYYVSPEELAHKVVPGKRAIVPFSGRKLTGYVVALSRKKPDVSLREILEVIDSSPIFDGKMLKLTRWVSDYYCSTWGEALQIAFPPGIRMMRESLSCEKLKSSARFSASSFFSEPELLCATTEERLKFYLHEVSQTLENGRGALILVPDISRSEDILKAMRARFEEISLLHGNLPPAERYREWVRMKNGISKIVIGTRSAVFAPLESPGLIIVDEEDNPLYKEKRTPKYNAREVALKRAELSGARLILGTQIPSLESYFQVECGKYKLLVPDQKKRKKFPEVEIVDLSHEFKSSRIRWALSLALRQEIEEKLKRNEKIILLTSRGAGAQKIMDELGRLFPSAHLGKIGSETRAAHEETFSLFHQGKIDILIGTQTVLKESGVERIGLLGIISIDTILNASNFRAAERTFQLLIRAINFLSGRENSKVIVQTYNPSHYSILSAARNDWLQFYRKELRFRRQLNYPPFTSLINITTKDREAFSKLVVTLKANCQSTVEPPELLTSLPSSLNQRWQITLRGKDLSRMRRVIKRELARWGKKRVNVEVNP